MPKAVRSCRYLCRAVHACMEPHQAVDSSLYLSISLSLRVFSRINSHQAVDISVRVEQHQSEIALYLYRGTSSCARCLD